MQYYLRLFMVILLSGIVAAILPLGWIEWLEPGRFRETIQREISGGRTEVLGLFGLYLVPSMANALVGYCLVARKSWVLVPLCLIAPVWVLVTTLNDAKGPIVFMLSLVPAGVCWLTGRLGQLFQLMNPLPNKTPEGGEPEGLV